MNSAELCTSLCVRVREPAQPAPSPLGGAVAGALARAAARVALGARRLSQRWREHRQLQAQWVALRGLEPRVLKDLGLCPPEPALGERRGHRQDFW